MLNFLKNCTLPFFDLNQARPKYAKTRFTHGNWTENGLFSESEKDREAVVTLERNITDDVVQTMQFFYGDHS